MDDIILDGASLTFDQVLAVAYGEPSAPIVRLSETAKQKVQRAADAVQKLLSGGVVAYGITTGFGAFKDKLIHHDEVQQLQYNILVSHAVGVGDAFDIPTTRAIMLIRANTLAKGYSGIRLHTLELLLGMLNAGVHPIIPEKGSLGASGDLAPLAHMSLPLIGEGEALYQGEHLDGATAMRRAGLEPIRLAAKEGLALTNGTAMAESASAWHSSPAEAKPVIFPSPSNRAPLETRLAAKLMTVSMFCVSKVSIEMRKV